MYRTILLSCTFVLFVAAGPCGAAAQAPSGGDLVISEILYASDTTDSDREYIELYNTTDGPVNLKGWTIVEEDPAGTAPDKEVIDTDVRVASGDFVVLCENSDPAENGGVDCAYDYVNATISHTNVADYVVLRRPDGTTVDRVHYDEDDGWPQATEGSIEYVGPPGGDNGIPANWERATKRAGDFASTEGVDAGSPNANAPDGALPVELTQFQARVEDRTVRLEWATASETGNAGFAVQHRRPGQDDWSRRGFVDGAGTTGQERTYEYSTGRLDPGPHVFRLKQVDLDGSVTQSETRRVSVRPSGLALDVSGPNPLRSGERLTVTITAARRVDVGLYNVLGQRVRTVAVERRGGPRAARVQLPARTLASGVYFLRVRGASGQRVHKFSVVR
jgi:hypothetical protein